MRQAHLKRDSLTGFNRKRLRGTLTAKMGVVSNAEVFASKGNTWETTPSEQRRADTDRQLLEHHLRQADTSTELRFIEHLRERLSDPGPLEPVKVNKKQLAQERKNARPARRPRQGAYVKVAMQVNRLAKLQRELEADNRVAAKTTDKYRDYGHFVFEKD